MKAKKYLLLFCLFTALGLAGISLVNYIVDPFFQYRVKDREYILNPRFVNPGLLKNYDYDMLLMGSSMTQLIDVPVIAERFNAKLLRTSSGKMNAKETEVLYSLAQIDKVNRFMINIDILTFDLEQEPMRYPEYLYKTDILNRITYLISYETCKFTPVDLYVSNKIAKQDKISSKMLKRMEIDQIGDFSQEIYTDKNLVILDFDHYVSEEANKVDLERMTQRFDEFIANLHIKEYKDKEYIFILPPYSILYWHAAKEVGAYSQLQYFVKYMLDKTKGYGNIRFVCMYDMDFITELDTYSDIMHYAPSRKEIITDALTGRGKDYDLSQENVDRRLQHLDSILTAFEKTDWRN